LICHIRFTLKNTIIASHKRTTKLRDQARSSQLLARNNLQRQSRRTSCKPWKTRSKLSLMS